MKARKVKGLDPDGPLAENAERIVAVRLEELCGFGVAALDPEQGDALHDMRIAAKRLRYVLELTRPALGSSARGGARTAKRLQDLLGEIHDCDVMLPRVRRHAERLRAEDAEAVRLFAGSRARDLAPAAAASAPNLDRYRGVQALATYLAARREVLYARFTREWKRLESRGFADELLGGLSPDLPEPQSSPAPAGQTDGGAP